MLTEDRRAVEEFSGAWEAGSARTRKRLAAAMPLAAIHSAAIHHPDPWLRRWCLGFLDHHASDASTSVFVAALDDPVAIVRDQAIHGLSCERCRTEELCVADVTPKLTRILASDRDPAIRYKTLTILRGLSARDADARDAIARAAEGDEDDIVRAAAAHLLAGGRPRRWNQFRRAHDSRRAKAARR